MNKKISFDFMNRNIVKNNKINSRSLSSLVKREPLDSFSFLTSKKNWRDRYTKTDILWRRKNDILNWGKNSKDHRKSFSSYQSHEENLPVQKLWYNIKSLIIKYQKPLMVTGIVTGIFLSWKISKFIFLGCIALVIVDRFIVLFYRQTMQKNSENLLKEFKMIIQDKQISEALQYYLERDSRYVLANMDDVKKTFTIERIENQTQLQVSFTLKYVGRVGLFIVTGNQAGNMVDSIVMFDWVINDTVKEPEGIVLYPKSELKPLKQTEKKTIKIGFLYKAIRTSECSNCFGSES